VISTHRVRGRRLAAKAVQNNFYQINVVRREMNRIDSLVTRMLKFAGPAIAPGNYTYSVGVPADFYITSVNGIASVNGVAAPVHWSIGSAPQTVTLSPVSSTITAGSSITFTATLDNP